MPRQYILILLVLLSFSCSEKDDNQIIYLYTVKGKLLAPNGLLPISNAEVLVLENSNEVAKTETNTKGEFIIADIGPGQYELVLKKGGFEAEREIDVIANDSLFEVNLTDIVFSRFPRIGVVTGSFDYVENVLYELGIRDPNTGVALFDIVDGIGSLGLIPAPNSHHQHHSTNNHRSNQDNPHLETNVDFTFSELLQNEDLLSQYDILFLSCGLSESFVNYNSNLTAYVTNGGLLYSTDYAFVYLSDITDNGSQYLDFYQPFYSGESTSVLVDINDQNLAEWLDFNFGFDIMDNQVVIDQFAADWQVVDWFDSQNVQPWLKGNVEFDNKTEEKYLAYTFKHGEGGVFYSSFHTQNNTDPSSISAKTIEYLLFEIADLND